MKNSVFAVFFLCSFSYSQSVSKQLIAATGGTLSNENVSVSFATGEPMVGLLTAEGVQLSSGYYEALDLETLDIKDNTFKVEYWVYPNPTQDVLYFDNPKGEGLLHIEIFDISGQKILEQAIKSQQAINVKILPNGTYFLNVHSNNTPTNQYKFIKQ